MAPELQSDPPDFRAEFPFPMSQEGDAEASTSWRLNVSDFSLPEAPKDPPLVSSVFRRYRGTPPPPSASTILDIRVTILRCFFRPLVLYDLRAFPEGEEKKEEEIIEVVSVPMFVVIDLIVWKLVVIVQGIVVFASVMGTLGLQVLLESSRQLITKEHPTFDHVKELWMVGSMSSVTVVKFFLMLYCRSFKNEIVRAYAQDHFFDVITNSIGLVTSLLAIALYTISTWAKTVLENVWLLIGRTAPPEFLAKLTYLIWNHHQLIKHIDTVRAYTLGSYYFAEVDIVLPADMPLSRAHDIGESLQEKLEQIPEIERAFVHVDFEFTHRPEHKSKV
ncbi:hypothetical protein GW17_00010253 [Ensete ventricosum]|nr:hypothetical protein GW17_00010253 [Ensete ventricosum]